MQPRFTVAILVLQAEGLVCGSRYVHFALPFTPAVIIPKPGCRPYRPSHAECRVDRSGSSVFIGSFRLLQWSSCVPAPKVSNCRYRCKYRYTCHLSGFLARGGCRPKRIRFPLRGRLKLSEKRKQRTCPTSGFGGSYGLRLLKHLKHYNLDNL